MANHITNRDAVLRALREELVGPCPLGEEIDCAAAIQLDDPEMAYRPYRQRGTGEEILQRDPPTKRYGVGVLYPMEAPAEPEELEAQLPPPDGEAAPPQPGGEPEPLTASAVRDCEAIAARAERRLDEADSDDFDLSSANAYKPSSMAVSLLVHLPAGAELVAEAAGGRYAIKPVLLAGREREWWLRSPVRLTSRFRRAEFPATAPSYVAAFQASRENVDNLDVRIELFARPYQGRPDDFLITVCLVNRQRAGLYLLLKGCRIKSAGSEHRRVACIVAAIALNDCLHVGWTLRQIFVQRPHKLDACNRCQGRIMPALKADCRAGFGVHSASA